MAEPSFTDADPALLGAVLSAMRVGVALLSPEGTLLHLNPAGAEFFDEILGRGAGWSVVGRSWDEAFGPDGSAEGVPPFEAALDGGSGETRPRSFRSPSGRYWNISLHGLPQGAFATFDEELAHTARHQQELTLVRQAVAALDVGVSISDARRPDCPLIFINDGFTRLTGYPATEALGRNCRFLQGPETDRGAASAIGEAMATGRSVQRTLLNYRKDGSSFWNRLTINPVKDRSGEVTHFIGIQEDVTERRRMGQQLQVSDRLNSVGRLAGGIAHDIRNVLAGAKALLQLALMRDDLPDDVVEDLEEADSVLGRGESVTSQLLAFAREQPVDSRVVDISELVRNRGAFLGRFLRDDIRVLTHADESLFVEVDLGRLDQVLFNLATNAEQAMPEGGSLTFWIRAQDSDELPRDTRPFRPEPGRRWIVLTVADTGEGMTEATRAQAFEPFFTTRPDEGGTGLGLASVFGTMEQMGGGVWIQSSEGEGTRVHLAFPAVEREPEGASAEGTRRFSLRTRTLTILLAEDDEPLRRTLSKALTREGHHVLPAPDGASARALFDTHRERLDLIVSDVMMPGMTGTELVRHARAHRPDLPVLLMSGYAAEGLGELDGNVRFLSKPFELDVALGVISALGSRRT